MSIQSDRHHDATLAAGQNDERLSVSQWNDLVQRCSYAAWGRVNAVVRYTDMYAIVDAALQEALPERFPETVP